jgi:hypothetical protein
MSDWFTPRGYAGLLLTFDDAADDDVCQEEVSRPQRRTTVTEFCEVTAKIGFLGAKGRLGIPIPYVAPFLELGLGLSFGVLRTRTIVVDEETEGVAYHIPAAVGLMIGEHHEFEVALSFLYHPEQRQLGGAFAFGMMFAVR